MLFTTITSVKMLQKILSQNLINLSKQKQCQRGLWWWTVLMFNRIDLERTKALGYDR